MNHSFKHLLTRAVFALFVALFFMTPVCTIFVPFCTVTWTLGVLGLATPVFILSGKRHAIGDPAPVLFHPPSDGLSGPDRAGPSKARA